VRGVRRISPAQRDGRLLSRKVTLIRPAPELIEIARPDGSKWRPDPVVYGAVMNALRESPRQVSDLLRLDGLPENHPVGPVELVGVLLGTGLAAMYNEPTAEQVAGANRFNALLDADPELPLARGATLAVAATRSGLTVSAANYALYLDLKNGDTLSADSLAVRFIQRCHASDCHPVLDGKTYEDAQEARVALTADYEAKLENVVPIWENLGIV